GLGSSNAVAFKGVSLSSTNWPGIAFFNQTISETEIGHRVNMETDGTTKNLAIYFRELSTNTGQSGVVIRRPESGITRNVAYIEEVCTPSNSGWSVYNPVTSAPQVNNDTTLPTGLYWGRVDMIGNPISGSGGCAVLQTTGNSANYRCQLVFQDGNGGRMFIRATAANIWGGYKEFTTSAVSDETVKTKEGKLDLEVALGNINKMEFWNFIFNGDKTRIDRETGEAIAQEAPKRRGVMSQQIMTIDQQYVKKIGDLLHLDQTPLLLDALAAIKALLVRDESKCEEIMNIKNEIKELRELLNQ
ncbi:hypothetical protein MXL54_23915, partial [Enterobacteriaceae bacterium G50]|nr:hypothetical protein [Enterobacteriaceae bacterium G50]